MNEKAAVEITLEVAATTGMVIAYHAQEAPDRMAVTTYGGNTMNLFRFLIVVMFGAALTLGVFPSVHAQEAVDTEAAETEEAETEEEETEEEETEEEALEEFTLGEIIITAERRSTSIMDTPLAVSALSADDLDAQSLGGITDLQMRMPSTTFLNDRIYIRGIGSAVNALGVDPAVGIFYDGAYNESLTRLDEMVDVERIEIIRGPQSTMYGRNTVAGAINVIFAKPTKEFAGQLKARFGNYSEREFTGIFSGPLIGDWLMGRVSLINTYYGGDTKNLYTDEYQGSRDNWKAYFKILYEPTDIFNMYFQYKVLYQYGTAASEGLEYLEYNILEPLNATKTSPNAAYQNPNPNRGGAMESSVANGNIVGFSRLDSKEVNLATDLTLGNFLVKHFTFYRWWYSFSQGDSDGTPNTDVSIVSELNTDTHSTSQELQILYGDKDTPISFLGGISYFATTKNYVNDLFCQGDLYWFYNYDTVATSGASFTALPRGQYFHNSVQLESHSKSIYANLDYEMTDALNFSMGYRYAIDEKWTMEDAFSSTRAYSSPRYNAAYQAAMGIDSEAAAAQAALLNPADDEDALELLRLGYHLRGTLSSYLPGTLVPARYKPKDAVTFEKDWEAQMWKVGFDYKQSDSSMIYFNVNRGYKPGGIDISGSGTVNEFDAEWLTSYEGGWKASWMADRIQTTLSVYLYDFQDKQMNYTRGYLDDEGEWATETLTTNAAGAENIGLEFEGKAYLTRQLRVNWQYSYMDAQYTDFEVWNYNLNKIVNLEGNRMALAPENKITVGGTYTYETDIGNFVLHGTYMWQDETAFNMFVGPNSWAKPWDRVDAELMWFSPDYKWRVTLWGKNITDHASVVWADALWDSSTTDDTTDFSTILKSVIDPIRFGVEISYKW